MPPWSTETTWKAGQKATRKGKKIEEGKSSEVNGGAPSVTKIRDSGEIKSATDPSKSTNIKNTIKITPH